MNVCLFVGNLGKDPDGLKYLPDGTAVLNFSIATDQGFGEKKKTNWVPLAAFGKTAENIAKFCKSGTKIEVETGYRATSKEGEDGKKQYFHNFVVNGWRVLANGRPAGEATETEDVDSGASEDEFPF
jgi:single-strand DNA-binding protein